MTTLSPRLFCFNAAHVAVPFLAIDLTEMASARAEADAKIYALPADLDTVAKNNAIDELQYPCDRIMGDIQERAVARLTHEEYIARLNGDTYGMEDGTWQRFPGVFRLPGMDGTFAGDELMPDYCFGEANPFFDKDTCDRIRHAFNAVPALVGEWGEVFYDPETDEFCCNGEEGDDDLITYKGKHVKSTGNVMYGLGRMDWAWERVHPTATTTEGGVN